MIISLNEKQASNLLENEKFINIKTLNYIEEKFSNNFMIQYHLGSYYQKNNDILKTVDCFNKTIKLNENFTMAYFKLSQMTNNYKKKYQLLNVIFCNGKTSLQENSFICSQIGPLLLQHEEYFLCKEFYLKLYNILKNASVKKMDKNILQTWKILSTELGNMCMTIEPDMCNFYYQQGLENEKIKKAILKSKSKSFFKNHDKQLVLSYIVSKNYTTKIEPLSLNLDNFFGVQPYKGKHKFNEKLRVGYISPDFNKNAVGLFSTVLLKYRKTVDVYCYYSNKSEDEFTKKFKSYNNKWIDISNKSDHQVYNLIKNEHKIDILVDLISIGIDNRLNVITMSPAPVIINYLGFPDTTGLSCYTHRISDKKMDTNKKFLFSEKMIFMPRNFICYKLWENIQTPEIKYTSTGGKLKIGIFNKISKQNKNFIKMITQIVQKRKDIIICIKDSANDEIIKKLYSEIPKNQLFIFPFQEKIENYFFLFNKVDILVDTFPYSGTTTTCSGLYMGLPSYCVYNDFNTHCSNVTGGFNLHLGFDNFNCENEKQLIEKITSIQFEPEKEQEKRESIREKFNELMDPEKFTNEYEEMLYSLVPKK